MGSKIGLGIDVGGTNTDAVLIDLEEGKILSFAKAPTTRDDLARGIRDVLYRLDRVRFPKIALISLSTTLATNSIVEGVRRRVCGILIGYEPGDYRSDLTDEIFLIPGGHTVLG
jgi:N-methylhydantoinase A/oxoprolinase/acetone carboxylase beta subunit